MANGNYYDGTISFPYIEKAVLLEDVKLPVYNKKKRLTRAFFYSMHRLLYKGADIYADNYKKSELNNDYKLAYNELKNIEASFYIPILTPTMDKNKDIEERKAAPKKNGFKGERIESKAYTYSNSIKLIIPKYILLQFMDCKNETEGLKDPYIPKGTEFIIAAIGGLGRLENIRIIGLFTVEYDKEKFPKLKDSYYGGNKVV